MTRIWIHPFYLIFYGILLSIIKKSIRSDKILDEWYPCDIHIRENSNKVEKIYAMKHYHINNNKNEYKHKLYAECILKSIALCHNGVCTDKKNSTINIFVKRFRPLNFSSEASLKQALWMIQGGPGTSSIAMEEIMEKESQFLGNAVDLYTMDHRGTGRSHILNCNENYDRLRCVKSILENDMKGHIEAFSVTSAAMDLKLLIEEFNQDQEVFVYGVSYGTYLVERLMQINPLYVKGYILDSVVSQASDTTFDTWDKDMGMIAEAFINICDENINCYDKIDKGSKNISMKNYIIQLYKELDKNNPSDNKCVMELSGKPMSKMSSSLYSHRFQWRRRRHAYLHKHLNVSHIKHYKKSSQSSPSAFLRQISSLLLEDQRLRYYIPVLMHLIKNCNKKNLRAIQNLMRFFIENQYNDDLDSEFLYDLIVYSEFWTSPTYTYKELTKMFFDQLISDGSQSQLSDYCFFSNSTDKGCAPFSVLMDNRDRKYSKFIYNKDKYYKSYSKIPNNSSVLLLSGKLDPQTHYKHAINEYKKLKGDNKMILLFNNSVHGIVVNSPMKKSSYACGAKIIASYVLCNGKLSDIDISCMNDLEELDFSLNPEINTLLFGRSNVYGI